MAARLLSEMAETAGVTCLKPDGKGGTERKPMTFYADTRSKQVKSEHDKKKYGQVDKLGWKWSDIAKDNFTGTQLEDVEGVVLNIS